MGTKHSKAKIKASAKQRLSDESDMYIHPTPYQRGPNDCSGKQFDDHDPLYQSTHDIFSTSLSHFQPEMYPPSRVTLEQAEHSYEEMVTMFQPLIVQNVLVKQLIPHLHFLENTEKLIAVANQDPRAAVIYLIDELKTNNKHPDRWKQFVDALESSEYKYIAGLLKGDKPMNHSYQREYLKIIAPYIRTDICPVDLAEVLWANDVISLADKEEIQQEHKNHGPLAAADKLLDRVPRKEKYWYSRLIQALKETKLESVAKMLEIPEIQNLCVMEDADNRPDINSDVKRDCNSPPTFGKGENQEDMDVFATCCRRHGADQNLQQLSPEDIHPNVRSLIKDVKQKKDELKMILHQEPLLKEKLALQTSINKKMTQKIVILNEIQTKEAEYQTLKGGINEYQSACDIQATETNYQEHYDDVTMAQAIENSLEDECPESPHSVARTVRVDPKLMADITERINNDSAFYSDNVDVRL